MIVLLDTSSPVCHLVVVHDGITYEHEWQADRELARGLHAFLRDRLLEHEKVLADIEGIGVMKGPGSFTGLRIGLTVLNTLADSLAVPIVGIQQAENWHEVALDRLARGENDHLVLPFYGREATITQPRK